MGTSAVLPDRRSLHPTIFVMRACFVPGRLPPPAGLLSKRRWPPRRLQVRKWFNEKTADTMEGSDVVKGIIEKVLGKLATGFRWRSPAVVETEINVS